MNKSMEFGALQGHKKRELVLDYSQKIIAPKSVVGLMGICLGAISVFSLLEHSLEFGLSSTIRVIFSYYDTFLDRSLSWLKPYLAALLNWCGSFFGFELSLKPHWKHIFVLLLIYFMRDAATDFRKSFYGGAAFLLFWGSVVAAMGSALAGAIQVGPDDQVSAFIVAFIPVIAAFVYTLLRRVWHATFLLHEDGETPPERLEGKSGFQAWRSSLYSTFLRAGTRTLVGAVVIATFLSLPISRSLANPGILAFAILVFCLAVYWMALGLRRAIDHSNEKQHWSELYWQQSASIMGASMVAVFFWVFVVLILNAGLQFAGL